MSWRGESARDVGWGDWEAQEARSARQAAPSGACYSHHFHSDGRGGGVCRCGETVGADEL